MWKMCTENNNQNFVFIKNTYNFSCSFGNSQKIKIFSVQKSVC